MGKKARVLLPPIVGFVIGWSFAILRPGTVLPFPGLFPDQVNIVVWCVMIGFVMSALISRRIETKRPGDGDDAAKDPCRCTTLTSFASPAL